MLNHLPSIQKRSRRIPGRRWMTRASVTIIIRRKNNSFDILLIKRAERKGDPWSGDMAFPGGKMSQKDKSIYHTGLRELNEEIGLSDNKLRHVGRLSDLLTKTHSGFRPMIVSPFVFEMIDQTEFTLNHEVAEVIWVPLVHFSTSVNRKNMIWKVKGLKVKVPCYWYKNRRVWGLTLRMIDELIAK